MLIYKNNILYNCFVFSISMFSLTVFTLLYLSLYVWILLLIGYPNGFTEKGSKGLICVLQRRLKDLKLKQRTVAGAYRGILEPGVRLVEEEDGELEEDMDSQSDDSSEDEDDGEEV